MKLLLQCYRNQHHTDKMDDNITNEKKLKKSLATTDDKPFTLETWTTPCATVCIRSWDLAREKYIRQKYISLVIIPADLFIFEIFQQGIRPDSDLLAYSLALRSSG